MIKKPDTRQEPPAAAPDDTAAQFRIDRVYAPPRPRESASRIATEVLASSRSHPVTVPPPTTMEANDAELTLRRQLSRLQRQLAEAQRELANKDDELATEVEKRIGIAGTYDAAVAELTRERARADELATYQLHALDVEQRLGDAIASAGDAAGAVTRERELHAATQLRLDELTTAFSDARARWTEERARLEAERATAVARLEGEQRDALEAAGVVAAAATSRLREAHEAELAQVRASHERSLAALRGELEPKLDEARNLAEERERLQGELAAARTEALRAAAERDEEHAREIAQLGWTHANEQSATSREHGALLARVVAEREAKAVELADAARASAQREQLWEQTVVGLREAHNKLELELAEAKDASARVVADKAVFEERVAAAAHDVLGLADENRVLRERAEAGDAAIRRNADDRLRFVAYLEEGLALLGALPAEDEPEITVTTTPDE